MAPQEVLLFRVQPRAEENAAHVGVVMRLKAPVEIGVRNQSVRARRGRRYDLVE
jgi:hypothetical protein